MEFIKPTTITDAMLISSTRAENDYAAWSSGTTYALGDQVISTSTHRIYKSVQAANTNHALTDTAWWQDVGPTNRWAMFDQGIGTITSQATPLTVVLAPGIISSLALFDLSATSVVVSMTDGAGGPTVYSQTFTLHDAAPVEDYYMYFFSPLEPETTLIVTDLPPYSSGRLTVQINAPTTSKCGTLVVGERIVVGKSLVRPTVSIIDYSRKETDVFGVTTVVERTYAKKVDSRFWFDASRTDAVAKQLSAVRATPCVWIVDDERAFDSLILYGFYKDWGIDIRYPNYSEASITIEGLT